MLAIMSPLGSHFNEICVLTRVWWSSCLFWFVCFPPSPSDRLLYSFCSQHITYLSLIGSRFKVRGRSNAQKNHIHTHGYHGVWSILTHLCYKTDQWRGPSGLKTWMDTHIDLHTLAFTSLGVWGTCWDVRLKGVAALQNYIFPNTFPAEFCFINSVGYIRSLGSVRFFCAI